MHFAPFFDSLYVWQSQNLHDSSTNVRLVNPWAMKKYSTNKKYHTLNSKNQWNNTPLSMMSTKNHIAVLVHGIISDAYCKMTSWVLNIPFVKKGDFWIVQRSAGFEPGWSVHGTFFAIECAACGGGMLVLRRDYVYCNITIS